MGGVKRRSRRFFFYKKEEMQIEIFTISVFGDRETLDEMNRFIRGHNVVSVKEKLVESRDGEAYWCYSVRYIQRAKKAMKGQGIRTPKIDYREVLDEATFAKYDRLRACRKIISEEEGVALYVVFSNAELAKIAALPELKSANLLSIEGIGKAKIEKYGKRILELYQKGMNEKRK